MWLFPPVLQPVGKHRAARRVCRTMCKGKPGFRNWVRHMECKISEDVHFQYHGSEILCFTSLPLSCPFGDLVESLLLVHPQINMGLQATGKRTHIKPSYEYSLSSWHELGVGLGPASRRETRRVWSPGISHWTSMFQWCSPRWFHIVYYVEELLVGIEPQ